MSHNDAHDDTQPGTDETPEDILANNAEMLADFLGERNVELIPSPDEDDYKSGFVAVIGKPNVGKSTLMNAILGEKLAIVSPKPQTTRDNQLGILTLDDAQIIFVDTPGIHEARTKLGDFMVSQAQDSIRDADVVVFIVDSSGPPDAADLAIAAFISEQASGEVIYVLNKRDLVPDDKESMVRGAYLSLLPDAEMYFISALDGDAARTTLLDAIVEKLPFGPQYYHPDVLTDTHIRDNAAEIIREQVLNLYEQEVPHSVAVKVNEFKERSDELTYIQATIYVERDSHKAIMIGKKGQALKQVGKAARPELEALTGRKVYLDLWVKVLKNWRKNETALKRLGFITD